MTASQVDSYCSFWWGFIAQLAHSAYCSTWDYVSNTAEHNQVFICGSQSGTYGPDAVSTAKNQRLLIINIYQARKSKVRKLCTSRGLHKVHKNFWKSVVGKKLWWCATWELWETALFHAVYPTAPDKVMNSSPPSWRPLTWTVYILLH